MSPELEVALDNIAELEGKRPKLTHQTIQRMWVIFEDKEPVFFCGVSRHSMLGQLVFWFMPCKQFYAKPRRYIKAIHSLLPMMKEIYPSFRVEVDETNKVNIRFVEAFGFRYSHTTENMKVYEV
jgi:hypothetical protein